MLSSSKILILTALLANVSSVHAQAAAQIPYTPVYGTCPLDLILVREAGPIGYQQLSAQEIAYIAEREALVLPDAWRSYLESVQAAASASSTTLPSYVTSILTNPANFPHFSIATSGGGYRAALFGAGVLNAFDARNESAFQKGTGGLLQASTYLAGLSGGGWLVGSLAQANFPTLYDLILGPVGNFGGWLTQFDLLAPSDDPSIDPTYFAGLTEEISGKFLAGFPVTVVDLWARILTRHFVNGTTAADFYNETVAHGAGLLWSELPRIPSFAERTQPFPILTADSSPTPGNQSAILPGGFVPLDSPIYEFTAFEMGSWDPMLSAFTPTKYLGTTNHSVCVTNYDQISYVQGTSSDVFPTFENNSATSPILNLLVQILEGSFPQSNIDLTMARFANPFFGLNPETYIASNLRTIEMMDGGEDGQSIPLQPLLVKARNVDTILAIDAAGDVNNFAAGISMAASQDRVNIFSDSYNFPAVPNNYTTFISEGLATRPTFFGCNAASPNTTPLIIYLANGGPPVGQQPLTNTSALQLSYSASDIDGFLSQTFDIATQGYAPAGETTDPEWPVCLACAVVDRARQRSWIKRSGACESCLARYCWS